MQVKDLSPDLILTNGCFYTLDSESSVARAVAIKDGRIVAVGEEAVVGEMTGPGTQQLDLNGRAVIPGIFDSHHHLMSVGAKLSAIRLDECRSLEEMMELVRERARVTPAGEWIIGQGFNESNFSEGRLPTRHDIDPATVDHPVILMRFFNTDAVNSRALRLAGVTRETSDPAGGRIEHDPDGEPNGILRASAKMLVRGLLPRPSMDDMKDHLRLACTEAHRYGITSVIEPGLHAREMRAYQSFYDDGELSVRVNMMPSWHGFNEDETETVLDHLARDSGMVSGLGNGWLRIGALKMLIDGGTTPHTAFMYEPYVGDSELVAFNRIPQDKLRQYFNTAQELGWDIGIHCCGDHAQDMVVDTLAGVIREIPRADARHSIIHGYFPTPRALDQMAECRLATVVQPTFIYWEGNSIFNDVGEDRALNWKPVRKYLNHGILVMSSSDVPSTVSANPFVALYSLVTRKNNLGREVALPEAVSREEALRAYTTNGTWLTREENLKGSIEAGKVADMVVLERDYFAVPDEEIKDIRVEKTMVGGTLVWEI
ncbi:Exoenzymes regulatory protein AepA precursor [Olavius sp. associated proteobacterium Delta 1]|nr:Exoenzymes regulatory protein AepA precursor [Olavius sp. associated proteobacterium Delta 1]